MPAHDVDLPRLAVYSTWGSTQEVGWVRYAFDKFEVPYDLIYKERVKQGALRSAYDVIVIPNQGGSGKRLVFDIEPKGRPLAYKKTERFKFLGMYGESDDITGGMGLEGAAELQKFADEGGVLVTLGTASFFPAEFGLTRASRPRDRRRVLRARPDRRGGDPQAAAPDLLRLHGQDDPGPLRQRPAAPGTRPGQGRQVLMQFPGGDSSVLSGLMKGASEIRNRPAIVDVPTGKGRVLLFATNPCYRWQNLGEFNMLFNTVLNFNDLN